MSTINNTDQFLVQRGTTSHKQSAKDLMSTIQDADLMLVQRGTDSYKVTCKDVKDQLGGGVVSGDVNQPTVVKPKDGAGSGDIVYALSDKITKIEGGGTTTCETELIESVTQQQSDGNWSGNYTVVNSNENCTTATSSYCPRVFFDGTQTKGYQVGLANNIVVGRQYTIEYVNTFPAGSYALKWDFGREGTADERDFSVYVDGVKQVIRAGNFGGNTSGTFEWQQSAPFTSLKFEAFGAAVGNAGIALQELFVNGTRLVDGTPVDIGTVLTFPSDQGFSCFPPDTLVQSGVTTQIPEALVSGEWRDILGKSTLSEPSVVFKDGGGIANSSGTFFFEGLNIGDTITWYGYQNAADTRQCTGDIVETTCSVPGSGAPGSIEFTVTAPSGSIKIDFNGVATCYGITPGPAAKVISIDDSDPYTITVDGGEWSDGTSDPGTDQSQVWSALLTSDTGFISPKTNAFDGDTSTHAASDTAGTLTFTPNLTVPANSTIEMWLGSGSGSNFEMTVTIDGVPSTVDGGSYQSVSYNNSTSINTITISRANSTNSAEIRAMKINGEVLVDAVGDRKLVKETPYDTKLTVATDKDFDSLLGTSWMTDGQGAPGPYAQTPYLVTSDTIVRVDGSQASPAGQIIAGPSGINSKTTIDIKDPMASAGITAIRGFAIYSGGATSAALFTVNVNGSNVLTSLTGLSDVGDAFAPIGTYTSYVQSGDENADNNGFYSFTFDPVTTEDAITFTAEIQDYNDGTRTILVMDQSGLWWTLINESRTPPPRSGFILTLASDQDLAYLRKNDVVQEVLNLKGWKKISGPGGFNDGTKTFDGNSSTFAYVNMFSSGVTFTWNTNAYQGETHNITVRVALNGIGSIINQNAQIAVAGTSQDLNVNTESVQTFNWSSVSDFAEVMFSASGMYNNGDYRIYDIAVDGVVITGADNGGIFGEVTSSTSIISIDETVPSITVDGGNWDNSNQSQVWSENATGAASSDPATQAFDGDISTYAAGTSSTLEIPFTAPITVTSLRVYADGPQDTVQVILDGNPVNVPWSGSPSAEWWNVPISGSASFSKIQVISSSSALYAVEANGRLLVDAVNDSQVWSSGADGNAKTDEGWENSFDGSVAGPHTVAQASSSTMLTLPEPVPFTTLEIYGNDHNEPGATRLYYSDTEYVTTWGSIPEGGGAGVDWGDVTSKFDGKPKILYKIYLNNNYNTDPSRIGGVRADGKLLLDKGIRDFGDTDVRYQTRGGKGDIVSVNATEKTILLTDTGDRDNRWIAENGADIDFKVAGPNYVDSPLLTSNVELESSQFSTTPATNPDTGQPLDGLAKITWSLKPGDGAEYELDAGTLNPYRPTGLQINTLYTIKVKHTGLLLGDSPWSTSTTFETGAARSLNDHYMKQIKVLEEELREARNS